MARFLGILEVLRMPKSGLREMLEELGEIRRFHLERNAAPPPKPAEIPQSFPATLSRIYDRPVFHALED